MNPIIERILSERDMQSSSAAVVPAPKLPQASIPAVGDGFSLNRSMYDEAVRLQMLLHWLAVEDLVTRRELFRATAFVGTQHKILNSQIMISMNVESNTVYVTFTRRNSVSPVNRLNISMHLVSCLVVLHTSDLVPPLLYRGLAPSDGLYGNLEILISAADLIRALTIVD